MTFNKKQDAINRTPHSTNNCINLGGIFFFSRIKVIFSENVYLIGEEKKKYRAREKDLQQMKKT